MVVHAFILPPLPAECPQLRREKLTTFFSGNGVLVAAMCADSHQYRPLLATEGGGHWRKLLTS